MKELLAAFASATHPVQVYINKDSREDVGEGEWCRGEDDVTWVRFRPVAILWLEVVVGSRFATTTTTTTTTTKTTTLYSLLYKLIILNNIYINMKKN